MAVAKRAQGAQSKLTMAFETDFGVTPSTGGVVMPIISSSLKACLLYTSPSPRD